VWLRQDDLRRLGHVLHLGEGQPFGLHRLAPPVDQKARMPIGLHTALSSSWLAATWMTSAGWTPSAWWAWWNSRGSGLWARERNIAIGLMTDARFSGGSVGLVIGHVGPEAALGGPIAFIEDGDEIVVDLNASELNCPALDDAATLAKRKAAWDKAVAANGGLPPNCDIADTRLLHRARATAAPATRGGGLHPNREVWVREPRKAERSGFKLQNKYRPNTNKAF